jgi:hypothetical protein
MHSKPKIIISIVLAVVSAAAISLIVLGQLRQDDESHRVDELDLIPAHLAARLAERGEGVSSRDAAAPAMLDKAIAEAARKSRLRREAYEPLSSAATRAILTYMSGDFSDFESMLAESGLESSDYWDVFEDPESTWQTHTKHVAGARVFPEAVRVSRVDGVWNNNLDWDELFEGKSERRLQMMYAEEPRSPDDPVGLLEPGQLEVIEVIVPATMRYDNGDPAEGEFRVRMARRPGEKTWYPMMLRILEFDWPTGSTLFVPPLQ